VKPTKPVTVKEPITFATDFMDIAGIEKDVFAASVKKYAKVSILYVSPTNCENVYRHIRHFELEHFSSLSSLFRSLR